MRTSSMKEGQPSNCQEARQSLFFIAIELFWRYDNRRGHGDSSLTFERGSVWSNRHFDDRQSWESVQEFTQVCTTEWIAFRWSFRSELFVEYKTRWRVGQLWAPADGLTTSPPRTSCSCSVDGQFNELWSGLFLLYACYTYVPVLY